MPGKDFSYEAYPEFRFWERFRGGRVVNPRIIKVLQPGGRLNVLTSCARRAVLVNGASFHRAAGTKELDTLSEQNKYRCKARSKVKVPPLTRA